MSAAPIEVTGHKVIAPAKRDVEGAAHEPGAARPSLPSEPGKPIIFSIDSWAQFVSHAGGKVVDINKDGTSDDSDIIAALKETGVTFDPENGLTYEAAKALAEIYGFSITRAAFELLSLGGSTYAIKGGGDDTITLADLTKFVEDVLGGIATGTSRKEEVFLEYLKANQFKIVNAKEAVKTFSDKYYSGSTPITVGTLLSHTKMTDITKRIICNILGIDNIGDLKDTVELTTAQLEVLFLTLGFLGSLDKPGEFYSPAKDIPRLESENLTTTNFLAWFTKGTDKAVESEKTDKPGEPRADGAEYSDLVAKAEAASGDEAIKLWESALEKAPEDKKVIIKKQRLIPAYLRKVQDIQEIVDNVDTLSVIDVAAKVGEIRTAIAKLKDLAGSADENKASIESILEDAKWSEEDPKLRNINGYLDALLDPARLILLKFEAKGKRLSKEYAEQFQHAALAFKEETIPQLNALDMEGVRKPDAEKLIKVAAEYEKFYQENKAALDGNPKILGRINFEIFRVYIMAAKLNPGKLPDILAYYKAKTGTITNPTSEEDATLLGYYGQLLQEHAAVLYGIDEKKEAMRIVSKESKPVFERIRNYYSKLLDDAKRAMKAAVGADAKLALKPAVDRYQAKVDEMSRYTKAGASGQPVKIDDIPEYNKAKQAVVDAAAGRGHSGSRKAATPQPEVTKPQPSNKPSW